MLLLILTNITVSYTHLDVYKRQLYYLSAEFLVGRLLGNNLLNLGLYEQVDNLLQSQGRSLAAIEELEAEPSPVSYTHLRR